MEKKKKDTLRQLLAYAGNYKGLTFLGMALSAVAMVLGMLPYICIWLVARDLIRVAPDWTSASGIGGYGWMAFSSAVAGIVVYFAALMCTHLAAFRTATNIRKSCMERLMHAPLGYFDNNASGYLRNRINGAASETETLLAHNMADITGTAAMFLTMLVLLVVFDWRMGLACLMAAIISVLAMFTMMGGKNARLMMEYQTAQDNLAKAGTEYVRGIPVVKVFQQTVYSFTAFKKAIDEYSEKAKTYTGVICRVPQSVNLTFTEGAFVFLVPVAVLLAPRAFALGDYVSLLSDFAFYAVFSAIISTALAKVMFASSGIMMAETALARVETAANAPQLPVSAAPKEPMDNSIEFQDVSFTYDGSDVPALDHVSFEAKAGQTIALVGPSGGGKTTAASLAARFWDVSDGSVLVGGADVREIDPHVLMDHIAFVFQNNQLFKTSILENVRAARPEASREEVLEALSQARCDDIIEKLPDGIDTQIGSKGTYLSGGEQQRIALARAILKDSPIVLLDEATAFADPENEVLIQKAFTQLTKGRTVMMIAHRLTTVMGADRIIVLAEGKVAEQGTHEELLAAGGLYAHMWADYQQAVLWKIGKEA
ncbi:MAG: ABC transporter ATP-binding protein/permease [Clostridia bacterium]|nr:ABC transporter ATP-binding protein/permease [Clostridia bacterium]